LSQRTPAGAIGVDGPTGLRRLPLARLPTPLEEAPRLAAALGLARLWIKREDLSGYALGGNKLRKLDFLLAEAIASGADTLIATAGYQSNFCRALAGAAAKAGLRCHLHLRASGPLALEGNLLLDRIFGASVTTTDATDPWDPRIRAELDAIAHDLRAKGHRPQVVQLTGESAPLGAAAWFSGAHELAADFQRVGADPDLVVVACGSGLTLAGLALGLKHLGSRTRVLGFSVQQPATRLLPWVVDVAGQTAQRLGIATHLAAEDLTILDDQIGPAYGVPTPAALEAVALAGRTEALVLDPVYTGKAFAGLAALARSGGLGANASAVFLHSGGTPGLFANAPAFAERFS
jgi:1-aminocyclopropane-1-carboxylate deaminase/D-cysteine desulfhydrase-like pyridoxal-dependent ACC family enzyme